MMDDELDVSKGFIAHSINKPKNCNDQQEAVLPGISDSPDTSGRLCFVITKNKSSSWVEDLYDCVNIAERTRVYN